MRSSVFIYSVILTAAGHEVACDAVSKIGITIASPSVRAQVMAAS